MSVKASVSRWFVLIFSICVWLACPAGAQVVGGSLSGTVLDVSGAVVPNATVDIENPATGVKRAVITDKVGLYVAPNLLPGEYQVTVSAAGFETQVDSGIVLTVGAQQVLNVKMQVGTITSKVQVNAQESTIELASSGLDALVNSQTVRQLPLNGRSWTDLAILEPGVISSAAQQDNISGGSGLGSRGFGNEMSISGARPQWNNYRLDGVSLNDYSNTSGSVLGGNLGVDATQEFSVLTSNFPAEYGMSAGGVVNAITRSGTNQFHGAVYEFLRNSGLDARNYFDPAQIPPFRRNQFGGDAGGPIWRDRLFIFGDYEGIRQSESQTVLEQVPSAAARSGQLCSVPSSSACSPHTITVDPSAQAYLPFWPLPNQGTVAGANGDIGIWNVPQLTDVSENFFTARGDYKASDKDSFDASYMLDRTPYTTPSGLNATIFDFITNRQMGTVGETHIFSPNFVNSARVGLFREAMTNGTSATAVNPLSNDTTLGTFPGKTAATVAVSGLTTFKGGVNAASAIQDFWTTYQESDDVFWTHGAHSVKFGGAVERIQENRVNLGQDGQWKFSSLTTFLENIPTSYSVSTSAQTVKFGFRQTIVAGYLQDDWQLRRNLTLNLGVRWEMITVPTEAHDKLAVLRNLTDATVHLGSPYYANATKRDFEPRVGFSWDPFRKGKTALRGGFGIFDVLPLPYEYNQRAASAGPFSVSPSVGTAPPGSFYSGIYALLGTAAASDPYIGQPHRSYVMQYNLNIQQQLPGRTTLTVGYVGSGGVHLPFRADDVNMVLPTLTPAGYVWPKPVGSGTKLNSHFGAIPYMSFEESSNYNGLQTSVNKEMTHGVQIQGSFTWQRAQDEGSSTTSDESFTNSIGALPFFDLHRSYGRADFDIKRTLVISGIWDVPSWKSAPRLTRLVTNGWEIGTIYQASDGLPFTPAFGLGGDPLGEKSTLPVDFPNVLKGSSGCQTLVNPGSVTNYVKTNCFAIPTAPDQTFYNTYCDPHYGTYPQCYNLMGNGGRNILTGPGLSDVTFGLYKNTTIEKRITTQFRAEFFNILNRANFNFPFTGTGNNIDTNVFNANGAVNPTAGLISSTATTSRQIQFGLKIGW
jgi:hypothetical protein